MNIAFKKTASIITAALSLTRAQAAENPIDNTQYSHFVAHNKTQTCSNNFQDLHFDQIRGVNLGGWFVLEPWITPSLFYQFLGKDEKTTALDMHSFCEVLGPEEGNKQLRRHWDAWVTKEIIEELAQSGAVNSLRLPVGDWMYKPYGPYVGCTDGALDYVELLLDWANASGISVLIDIHGLKGSQNGFDNSGQCQGFKWTSVPNNGPVEVTTFEHWPIRSAGWMGTFDHSSATYHEINYENIQHALDTIEVIVDMYKDNPAVLGLQPVNEPWTYTPVNELKNFYWEGYLIVKKSAPYWKYIMHDSFRFKTNIWGGFMAGCPDRVLDTHIYQAWNNPASRLAFYDDACSAKDMITNMEREFGPVIVGEWSLATDNCAMWLNGFNDNLPGYPKLPCKYIPCPDPYMGFDQPGTPVDSGKPLQGPFGSGMSGPIYGFCPVSRDWLKESPGLEIGEDFIKVPPEAPPGKDASDEVMTKLAFKKIHVYSEYGHGFYFWNFRTDIDEPYWSYMLALGKGWIPKGNLNDEDIKNACYKEDQGLYICVAKRDQLERNIRMEINKVLNKDGLSGMVSTGGSLNKTSVDDMSGDELYEVADKVYGEYFRKHRKCYFGGTAEVIEENKTYTANDFDEDASSPDAHNANFLRYSGETAEVIEVNKTNTTYDFDEDASSPNAHNANFLRLLAFTIFGLLVGVIVGFFARAVFGKQFMGSHNTYTEIMNVDAPNSKKTNMHV